jgi:hypothetical protein
LFFQVKAAEEAMAKEEAVAAARAKAEREWVRFSLV